METCKFLCTLDNLICQVIAIYTHHLSLRVCIIAAAPLFVFTLSSVSRTREWYGKYMVGSALWDSEEKHSFRARCPD